MMQYTDTLANMQKYKAGVFTKEQADILAETLENTIKAASAISEISFT